MAKELGFEGLMMNSLNAVGDRDFATETMQWAAMLMGHVSRISEDMIIYSTAEFGFLKLSDAYSTGSSLMPQKVGRSVSLISLGRPSMESITFLTAFRKTRIAWSSCEVKVGE